MDEEALDRRLGRLPEIMEGRPYAVNVVSLAENSFRETHLAWIKKHRPRFVWIAGGDLSPLRELIECGIGVMYIAPDEAMLKLALKLASGMWSARDMRPAATWGNIAHSLLLKWCWI